MRGIDGARNFVVRLRWVLFGLLVVAAAAQAAGVTVTPTSTGYYRMGTNAAGGTVWGTRTQFAALWENALGGAGSSFVTRTGAVSSTTVGSLARKALRGGVYAAAVGIAVEGIIDGAGWAINELKDQVSSPGTAQDAPPGTLMHCASPDGNLRCTTTVQGAIQIAEIVFENCTGLNENRLPSWSVYCRDRNDQLAFQDRYFDVPVADAGSGSEPSVITDGQLGDEVKKSPEVVSALLTDPRTNTPVMTPEMQAMADEIKRDIEQRMGLPETPDSTAPDLGDDTPADGGESPWPGFCDWASVVCDWLEWTKKDDGQKEPLPETDVQLPTNGWSSGVGEGSCPAPEQFDVNLGELGGGDGEFSWQPLCDTATMLRPVLITVASIVAFFILAGLRSTNTK